MTGSFEVGINPSLNFLAAPELTRKNSLSGHTQMGGRVSFIMFYVGRGSKSKWFVF